MSRLELAAAECAEARMWPLSDEELVSRLDTLFAVGQRLHAALLHALRELDGRDVPRISHGAASTNAWLRQRMRVSSSEASRLVRTARLVDAEPALDSALAAGALNTEQLIAIGHALDGLPGDLDAALRTQAVSSLTEFAAELDPVGMRAVGCRILEHVAPEVAEERAQRQLSELDKDAHERRYLTLTPLADGTVRIRGQVDSEAAATITAALDPLCAPRQVNRDLEQGVTRSPGQRRADALIEVFRIAVACGELPENGGDRPQLSVTIPYDVVRRQLGAGRLDSGEPISAATARRLACDARILPFVLGGAGQVLDAGRARRLVTGPLRRALVVRDRGCTFPGCDRPARWCEGHHIRPWLDGGRTDLANLALLCRFHHQLIHADKGWSLRPGAGGLPQFLPPKWLDPQQAPRSNTYHQRE